MQNNNIDELLTRYCVTSCIKNVVMIFKHHPAREKLHNVGHCLTFKACHTRCPPKMLSFFVVSSENIVNVLHFAV